MDRKTIIVVALCLGLLLLWSGVIVPKLYPPIRVPAADTNAVVTSQGTDTVISTNTPSLAPATTPIATPGMIRPAANTNVAETTLVITNENARYTFTSHGGGLKLVELIHYPETISRHKDKGATNGFMMLNANSPAPMLAVLGGEAVQGDGIFTLSANAGVVRAEKALPNGLVVVKEFKLSTNYLLTATVRLENHSTQTLTLPSQEWVVGTATPMNAQDDGTAVGMMWYDGKKSQDIAGSSYFSARGFACMPRTPPAEYHGGQTNVAWAAVHNQFFTLAVVSQQQPAVEVTVRRIELPRPSGEQAKLVATNALAPQGYEAVLVYPALTLVPNQLAQRQFIIFAGPKEYRTLARIAAALNNNLDEVMAFGSIWGWVAKALLLTMNWLHEVLQLGYGWTIVFITVFIKVIFWPLTAASTRSMKKMQALAPQVNAIKEKHKEDPMKAQRKTMELYKENKVSPLGGCLPMLIQMPVFIGFFTMIRSAIELRGASFLWIFDLARPDTLFVIPGLSFIPVLGIPGVGLPFNLLPLIMGVTMLWQSHLAPPSPGMDPMQQKIMRYMPLMFMLFLYNYSAGLTLYWTVNNLLTIVQTKLTRTMDPGSKPGPALTSPPKKRK